MTDWLLCVWQLRKEIEKLLEEQEELHQNLSTCKSFSRQDSEDTQNVRSLLEQGDMLEDALKKERQCQKEIEKEVN